MAPEVVFVKDGRPTQTAHELGHSFGLEKTKPHGEDYVLKPDNTCCQAFGTPTKAGYWVQGHVDIPASISYMGSSPVPVPYPDIVSEGTSRWTTVGNFSQLFQKFIKSPSDPEVLLITGTISQSGLVKMGPMYRAMGTASEPNPGAASIRVLDLANKIVGETNFALDFRVFAEPTIVSAVVPFAFSVPFPVNAAQVQFVGSDGQVLARVDITSKLLNDAVAAIPDRAFVRNAAQQRKALLNKLAALESRITARALNGARSNLVNDIRKDIVNEILEGYAIENARQYTKAELLALVDEMIQRLVG